MHSMQDKGKGEHNRMHNYIMLTHSLDTCSVREMDMGTRHEREHMGSTQEGMQGESAQAHVDAMEMRGQSRGYPITCGSSCEGLGLSTKCCSLRQAHIVCTV